MIAIVVVLIVGLASITDEDDTVDAATEPLNRTLHINSHKIGRASSSFKVKINSGNVNRVKVL